MASAGVVGVAASAFPGKAPIQTDDTTAAVVLLLPAMMDAFWSACRRDVPSGKDDGNDSECVGSIDCDNNNNNKRQDTDNVEHDGDSCMVDLERER